MGRRLQDKRTARAYLCATISVAALVLWLPQHALAQVDAAKAAAESQMAGLDKEVNGLTVENQAVGRLEQFADITACDPRQRQIAPAAGVANKLVDRQFRQLVTCRRILDDIAIHLFEARQSIFNSYVGSSALRDALVHRLEDVQHQVEDARRDMAQAVVIDAQQTHPNCAGYNANDMEPLIRGIIASERYGVDNDDAYEVRQAFYEIIINTEIARIKSDLCGSQSSDNNARRWHDWLVNAVNVAAEKTTTEMIGSACARLTSNYPVEACEAKFITPSVEYTVHQALLQRALQ